jgi:hypothetical protein
MYNASQQAGTPGADAGAQQGSGQQSENVTDAEFEEVK